MAENKSTNAPPHVRKLSLRNFRGFQKTEDISLAPLTFLVGPNSAGKSSLFDALLLIAQSHFTISERRQVPNWSGPLVDLGTFRDCVYRHDTDQVIQIGVELSPRFMSTSPYYDVSQPMRLDFAFKTTSDDAIGWLSAITVTDVLSAEHMTFRYRDESVNVNVMGRTIKKPAKSRSLWNVSRETIRLAKQRARRPGKKAAWQRLMRIFPLSGISAVMGSSERVSSGRSAPRRWYSLAETAFDYSTSRRRVFDGVEPIMVQRSPYFYRRNLKTNLNSVLGELEIGDHLHDSQLSPYHIALSIRDNVTGVTSNLIDVGFGASQVIPVLWACFSNASGPLFIEQPEIHLHPKAQGTLADLICDSSRRRQVVVETHSVHMVNRARIMIAQGKLPAEHVIVNYVSRKRDGSYVHKIPILPNGDFGSDWPEGFFDERYEDTMLLLKLKSQKES